MCTCIYEVLQNKIFHVPLDSDTQWSGERSGSALYGRFYLQTGCAYAECNEEHAKMKFLVISLTRHISETKASIFVAFALKSSATYLFYDDCV